MFTMESSRPLTYAEDSVEAGLLSEMNFSDEEAKELLDNNFDYFEDKTRLIKILFTYGMYDEAYEQIRAHKEVIDYADIMKHPMYKLDRYNSSDIYKYMYDNAIIGEYDFMCFEVLSGKFNDNELWTHTFDNIRFNQCIDIVYDIYENFIKEGEISTFDVGLIELTDEQFDNIFKQRLEKGESADYLFEKIVFSLNYDQMTWLIKNDNVGKNDFTRDVSFATIFDAGKYFNEHDNLMHFNRGCWDTLYTYIEDRGLTTDHDLHMHMFMKVIDSNDRGLFRDVLYQIATNSIFSVDDFYKYALNNIYFVKNLEIAQHDMNEIYFDNIDIYQSSYITVDKYLDDENMEFSIIYKLNECNGFITSAYLIKQIDPYCLVIYNKSTDNLYLKYKNATPVVVNNPLKTQLYEDIMNNYREYTSGEELSYDEDILNIYNSETSYLSYVLGMRNIFNAIGVL